MLTFLWDEMNLIGQLFLVGHRVNKCAKFGFAKLRNATVMGRRWNPHFPVNTITVLLHVE